MAENSLIGKCNLIGTHKLDPKGDVTLVFHSKHVIVSSPSEVKIINAEDWNSKADCQIKIAHGASNKAIEGQGTQQEMRIIYDTGTADIEFRVSSRHLSLSSPYFEALLSKNFLEGKALNTTGHVRVIMEDDPAHGAKIVLGLLHHDYQIPNMTPSLMMQTAILIDKWNLSTRLSFWTRKIWTDLQCHEPCEWNSDSGPYLGILSMLNFKEELRKSVVLFAGEMTESIECDFPPVRQIMDPFVKLRFSGLHRAFSSIAILIEHYCSSWDYQCKDRSLDCDNLKLGGLIFELSDCDLYPLPKKPYCGISINSLLKKLKTLVWEPCCHDGSNVEDSDSDDSPAIDSRYKDLPTIIKVLQECQMIIPLSMQL